MALDDKTSKIVLDERDLPTHWYNVVPDLPSPPAPPPHPNTGRPLGPADLAPLFPMGIILQEVSQEPKIEIPDQVRDIYRLWRPTPMYRARRLEQALDTPAHIYYKYEGVSPAGSHKPNTAVAQAFYNKQEGTKRLTTETGAGQWGSALSLACSMSDLDCTVYMLKSRSVVGTGASDHQPATVHGGVTMPSATTSARTGYGDLQGATDRGVTVFRGVPFARPPVGPLRFAAPQPPDAWTGVRDATAFGPPAMQGATAASPGLTPSAPPSEDCLTLNVWTPAPDDARRPVMVYLHGGAFMFGSGSMPMFHGATLAQRGDVVVVTINYRLGLFGYLRGIDVCGDALPSTGNEGLLDQLAALRWVKEQIAAFGGDPENVTVFGQSAGAGSIAAMLSMPAERRPFHKAILQSGSAAQLQAPEAANRVMETILTDLGLASHEAGRLRNLPAEQLLEIQTRVTPPARGAVYRPVADGVDLPTDPEATIAGGSAAGIPLLIGTNLEEWRFYILVDPEAERLTDDGLLTRLADPRANAQAADNAQFDPAEAVAMHRQARAARSESTTAWDLWVAIMSDRRFRVPSMRLAERQSTHTPETYAYLFTWKSPGWDGRLGAGHEVQVPFVFGTLDAPDSRDLVPAGSPVGALPELMQDAWVAFARTGSPRTRGLPDWEPYSPPRRRTMILGTTTGSVDAPNEVERRFWAECEMAGRSG